MPVLELEKMTSPAVRRAIGEGHDTIVCPFGSLEQHAAHLPIGTDAMLGDEFGWRLAEQLDAFLVPTVRVGCAEHHMPFAGTMSVSEDTLRRLAGDYARSLARHGFKRIVLLATHGGNFKPLAAAAEDCQDMQDVSVISPISDFTADVLEPTHAVSARYGISAGESGGHSGEWETSIMLHLAPELVEMDHAVVGYTGGMSEAVSRLLEDGEGIDTVTGGTGILGDPRRADGERGAQHLDALTNAMIHGIERSWSAV
jgi:creatinine amidohydrolase